MNGTLWTLPPSGTQWVLPPNSFDIPGYTGSRRDTAWKLNSNTTPNSFIGRPLVPEDANRTKYDDSSEEDLLRLGWPSQQNWSPMVDRWGLQVLNAAGFINGHVPVRHTDPTLNPKGRFHTEHPDDPIHPVLRREMWLRLADKDWNLILPSLRLASAILDTPEILTFFSAFFEPFQIVHAEIMKEDVKLVEPLKSPDAQQLQNLYLRLVNMRNYTRFQFVPEDKSKPGRHFGRTHPLPPLDGMVPAVGNASTVTTRIFLTEGYLTALRLEQDPVKADRLLNWYQQRQKADMDRRIHIDAASAGLRTAYGLAQCILHELGHAVCRATFPRTPKEREPYFPGDRYSEVGHAFERYMFGGSIKGMYERDDSLEQSIQAPYGLALRPDPTWNRSPGLADSYESFLLLPVHMTWVSALFQREFWDETVARGGGRWLQTPRFYEWATISRKKAVAVPNP